jgi:DNA adenine methylase
MITATKQTNRIQAARRPRQAEQDAPCTPSRRIRPLLRWPGGKSRMLRHLLPLIPPHVCYCEVFAGGLAVLLAKSRSNVEVINDLNGDLVALYRNVQYHLPELLRELEFLFTSRTSLRDFNAQPGVTEIQRAARFLFRNRSSFGGGMTSFAVSRTQGGSTFSRAKVSELLGPAHERLDGVVVENLTYERCMALYDSPDTFFFMDPPYLNAPTGAYEGFTEDDMRHLRERIRKLKGQWLLTVDDSELNRELFADCRITALVTKSGRVNQRLHPDKTFGELIIQPS